MRDVNSIEEMFIKRYNAYRKHTMGIIKSMEHVTKGIELTLVDEEYETLAWEEVQYIPEDQIVVLSGNIKLTVGDDIQLDTGKVVTVTEENVDGLRRIVRVGIPVKLALDGSAEDVFEFLKGSETKNYTLLEDQGVDPADKDDTAIYNQDYSAEIDLTDEQYESMKLTPPSKKVH